MPQKRLRVDDKCFIMKMKEFETSNRAIAKKMGITEGTVRYHLKKRELGIGNDHRKNRPSGYDQFKGFIKYWIAPYLDEKKRPTFKLLYMELKEQFDIELSYDALRRYMSKHFPNFHRKPVWLRIQTPPGVLMFVDWKEDFKVQLGRPGNWITMNALVFSLAFSGKISVVYSRYKNLDSFIAGHQKGFKKLKGLTGFIRPDCLKSAVKKWRGINSEINDRYYSYLKRLGVTVDPARPGRATDKGKVEKRIRDFFYSIDFKHRVFTDLNDLQEYSDNKIKELEKEWRSSTTGKTVTESFDYEKQHLKPVPKHFPILPVRERYLKVRRDGTVSFCNNYYQMGSYYVGRTVLCMNTGTEIEIYLAGERIGKFPYLPEAERMVMLSEEVLKKSDYMISDRVLNWGIEVARRQIKYYEDIVQGVNQ